MGTLECQLDSAGVWSYPLAGLNSNDVWSFGSICQRISSLFVYVNVLGILYLGTTEGKLINKCGNFTKEKVGTGQLNCLQDISSVRTTSKTPSFYCCVCFFPWERVYRTNWKQKCYRLNQYLFTKRTSYMFRPYKVIIRRLYAKNFVTIHHWTATQWILCY
jgi:hypothetical protein